jgi:GGDEF domain-containing protein
VAQPTSLAEVEIIPNMSIGSALAQTGDTNSTLLARADDAMYTDKACALRERLLRS